MTAALRKQAERRRRAARGEVALSGWLSASDHAALTQMARDSGMTQGQVVGRLIGMKVDTRRAIIQLRGAGEQLGEEGYFSQGKDCLYVAADLERHSDLTAAIGLNTAKAGNEGEG